MQPGTLIADQFEIERLAGEGGMGTVYKARDRLRGEAVAIKILRSQAAGDKERFEREARVLEELRHPGIVRSIGHGLAPSGEPFLAMEWLEGEDLGERLARTALSVAETLTLAAHTADALAAAHARGVVHRDIKPSNLFLPEGDLARVKLLDFGIARRTVETRPMTRTGMLLGTPGYLAPEQARGARDADARADVFSLGCVLFEALTGRPAFAGEHVMAILARILFDEAPRVGSARGDVPPDLEELVARMLAKDPAERPADGAALGAALAQITLDSRPATLPPPAVGQTTRRPLSLTEGEQRLVSVILVSASASPGEPAHDRTLSPEELAGPALRLRTALKPFGARVEGLSDGTVVAALTGGGGATDQAAQAARCALAASEAMPEARVTLATGRGLIIETLPIGEVIDRAVAILQADSGAKRGDVAPGARRRIRLDNVTAGLLDGRFAIAQGAAGPELAGEQETANEARTLLGRRTPCVGRERELATLRALLDECLDEPKAVAAIVTGAPGIGKSRIHFEVAQDLERRRVGAEVWVARGDPMRRGSPFGLAAEMLRRAVGMHEGEPPPLRREKLSLRVSRRFRGAEAQRVAAFLGEIAGAAWPDDDIAELRAARQDPRRMSEQIGRAWEDFCGAACDERPLVMVLEDLHWADGPSVKLIDGALRAARDKPLFVLALARPEVHELFPQLWAERGAQEIRLGELSRRASEKLARAVLGEAASRALVEQVATQAGGNAFFLEELIRAAAGGGAEALPETVLAMVQSRLFSLAPEARRLLRAGSVFGATFWEGGAAALLGGDEGAIDVGAWLARLVDGELLVRRRESRFPGEQEVAFRHAFLREGAYQTLTEGDRALGHALAGDWLERAGEGDAAALAAHFEQGGERARAAELYVRAAEEALRANDLSAVHAAAQRSASCGAEGSSLGRARLAQAEAALCSEDRPAGIEHGLAAMGLLPPWSMAWCRAAMHVTTGALSLGDMGRLTAILRELEGQRDVPAAMAPQFILLAVLIVTGFTYTGLAAEVRPLVKRLPAILEVAEEEAHRRPEIAGYVHFARGFHALLEGGLAANAEGFDAAVEPLTLAGDTRLAATARTNAALGYFQLGAFEEAKKRLADAHAFLKDAGMHPMAMRMKILGGVLLAYDGAFEEARALVEEVESALDNDVGRDHVAYIHLVLGDLDAAEREARAAYACAVVKMPTFAWFSSAVLAKVSLQRGRAQEALAWAREASRVLTNPDGLSELGFELVRLVLAEALDACNEREEAAQVIALARARILELASKIADPARRRAFLERLPENARTLELAARWLGEAG